MTTEPLDGLRWIAARVEQLTALDEPDVFELLEYVRDVVARYTDDPAHYSDGTPVVTHYWCGDVHLNSHLNPPRAWNWSRS